LTGSNPPCGLFGDRGEIVDRSVRVLEIVAETLDEHEGQRRSGVRVQLGNGRLPMPRDADLRVWITNGRWPEELGPATVAEAFISPGQQRRAQSS
jgi:hypothetical protein